jgi:hypothetical protein
MLVAQLNVPVREIDKVSPALMLLRRKRHMNKRPPLRPLRFADKRHVSFVRKPIPLAGVTGNARTNHILPNRRPAAIARENMIEIQLAALENLSAILAGVFVALENVMPRKFHFLLRQAIEKEKHDYTRDSNLPRNGGHHFVFRRGFGKIEPAIEIVREEIILRIGRNDLRVARIHEREGAPRRADIHRLPQAIQNQNLTVK